MGSLFCGDLLGELLCTFVCIKTPAMKPLVVFPAGGACLVLYCWLSAPCVPHLL